MDLLTCGTNESKATVWKDVKSITSPTSNYLSVPSQHAFVLVERNFPSVITELPDTNECPWDVLQSNCFFKSKRSYAYIGHNVPFGC